MHERLKQQLQFILEIDRLKTILRQNIIADRSRPENSAEHSWHLAVMACVLHEHFPRSLKLEKTVKMLLIHDIVEVYAGDTFAYATTSTTVKNDKEAQAAARIFSMLPPDQNEDFLALWNEFEEGYTDEARAARALDRLQPILLNFYTDGASWKKHSVHIDQVRKRIHGVREISAVIADFVEDLLLQAVQRGFLKG